MRIAFYCGIVAFFPFGLLYLFLDFCDEQLGGDLVVLVLLLHYFPLLIMPALQRKSWKTTVWACVLSPLLLIAHALLGTPFRIDSRILNLMDTLVPGGESQMNPGGPIQNLIPQLLIYIALVALSLGWTYRGTKIAGLGYLLRCLLGSLSLAVLLMIEISLMGVNWSEVGYVDSWEYRVRLVIASSTWLLSAAVFCALVFGVKPSGLLPKKQMPKD
jgi:hypothetical protein